MTFKTTIGENGSTVELLDGGSRVTEVSSSQRGLTGESGTRRTMRAAVDMSAGDFGYLLNGEGGAKADATAEGKEAIFFVRDDVLAGDDFVAMFPGCVNAELSGLVEGDDYYMSMTPGGVATGTQAALYSVGNVIRKLGTALSDTELLFLPEAPITL